MAKYKSRATRASEVAGSLRSIIDELRDVVDNLQGAKDEKGLSSLYSKAGAIISTIDASDLESLAEEMGNWRDNMSGTNLESTDKYSRVEEVADTLENAKGEIEGISLADIDPTGGEGIDEPEDGNLTNEPDLDEVRNEMVEAIEEAIDTLESATDEIENAEFPGMFG